MKRLLIFALLLALALPAWAAVQTIGICTDVHPGDESVVLAAAHAQFDTDGVDAVVHLGDTGGTTDGLATTQMTQLNGDDSFDLYAIIGNHDGDDGGARTKADFLADIVPIVHNETLRFTFDVGNIRFIGLDCEHLYDFGGGPEQHHNGYLPPDELAWLEEALAAADTAGKLVVIGMHQPVGHLYLASAGPGIGLPFMEWEKVRDVIEAHDSVIAVVSGHRHVDNYDYLSITPSGRPILYMATGRLHDVDDAYCTMTIDDVTGEINVAGYGTHDSFVTNTWTGAVDTNYSVAGNWSEGHFPAAAEIAVIRGAGALVADVGMDTTTPRAIDGSGYTGTLTLNHTLRGFCIGFGAEATITSSFGGSVTARTLGGGMAMTGDACFTLAIHDVHNEYHPWRFTGAYTSTKYMTIYAGNGRTLTIDAPINLGAAEIRAANNAGAQIIIVNAKVTCGALKIYGFAAGTETDLRLTAGSATASVLFGSAANNSIGKLTTSGAVPHVIAGTISAQGAETTHELNLGGRVELGGNVTLAGITTAFGDAKIDATTAITFDGTNATGTTSGNCIITGRGGLVTFTAMQTNFTGRPILARRYATDAGSVVAVQPAAPHWLTGLR